MSGSNVINTFFLHKFVNCVSAGWFSSALLASWVCDHVIIASFSHVNTLCVFVCVTAIERELKKKTKEGNSKWLSVLRSEKVLNEDGGGWRRRHRVE